MKYYWFVFAVLEVATRALLPSGSAKKKVNIKHESTNKYSV